MTAEEQVIERTAERLSADVCHGMKPESDKTARDWFINAIRWAKHDRRFELAARLSELLTNTIPKAERKEPWNNWGEEEIA